MDASVRLTANTQPTPDLALLVDLVRTMEAPTAAGSRLRGQLIYGDAQRSLVSRLSSGALNHVEFLGEQGVLLDPDELRSGGTYTVEVSPRGSGTLDDFYFSLADLLEKAPNLLTVPRVYYLLEEDYCSWDLTASRPEIVAKYVQVTDFIKLARESADFVSENGHGTTLVFMRDGPPIKVEVRYAATDLGAVARVDDLEHELDEGPFQRIRRDLFNRAIVQLCVGVPADSAFPHLLRSLDSVWSVFSGNLQLFQRQFDFDSHKEKLLGEKRELLLQIGSVVTDAQNKLLAVPASLLIAGSQMVPAVDFTAYARNVAILIATVAVTVLTFLLTAYQSSQIQAVAEELRVREKRWQDEVPGLHEATAVTFKDLNARRLAVTGALGVVKGVAVAVQVAALGLFILHIPGATGFVKELFEATVGQLVAVFCQQR